MLSVCKSLGPYPSGMARDHRIKGFCSDFFLKKDSFPTPSPHTPFTDEETKKHKRNKVVFSQLLNWLALEL